MNQGHVGAITALVVLLVASSTATADQDTLDDPILLNAAAIAKAPAIPGVVMTEKRQLAMERSIGAEAPIGAIGKLEIKAEGIVAPPSITSGGLAIEPLKTSTVQSLAIDGQVYDLVPVDQTIDEKFGLRVVTMRVLNQPGSYARFTIAMDGAIVGTLLTPKNAYRIAPVEPGQQLIYRLTPDNATQMRSSARADKLERRHVQLEQLAAIHPDRASSSEQGGTLSLMGGRLGKVPQGNVTPETLKPILRNVADLAFQSTVPDIRISYVERKPGGGRIEFEQMIGGIPVLGRNVIVLAGDGTVLELRTMYVDPARVKTYQPSVDLNRAKRLAQEALEKSLRKKLVGVELINDARLRYRALPSSRDVVLEYQFDLGTKHDGNWIVTIDGYDGTADVQDSRMFGTGVFGHRVCRDISSTNNPIKCTSTGAQIVWTAPYQGSSDCLLEHEPHEGNNPCQAGELGPAHNALLKADTVLAPIDAANPPYCCDKLGGDATNNPNDHLVDVNINSSAWSGSQAFYDRPTGTIVSTQNDLSLMNYEVTWHELGHHDVHMYNLLIANAGQSLNWFEGAFNEGIADTFSAAIAAAQPAPMPFWNDPWIIGDGSAWPTGVLKRNCKNSAIDYQTLTNTTAPAHEQAYVRGTWICAFFYRVQRDSGISAQRLLQLVLNVIDRIVDSRNDGLDTTDFKKAVLDSIASNETVLLAKAKAVYANMMEGHSLVDPPLPDNEPPPAGTPGKPTLSSTGYFCAVVSGGWSTIWNIVWQAVPQADIYAIYVKSPYRPFPDDLDVTTATHITAGAKGRDVSGAYTSGWVFGRSCNHLNCSASSNNVPISMLGVCDLP